MKAICSLTVFLLSFCIIRGFSQSCSPGDPSGPPGGGVPPPGIGWPLPVINSYDPNDIVPPATVGTAGWVRRDALLPFMIRCENHPDSATAPVQEAWIYLPFHANADKGRFRLGDIGFGDFFITVPPDRQSYTIIIDAVASLGVRVLVEAGIESAQNRAYWHFRSIDPATGQLPADPMVGFLPVNDTVTHRGEAFAHFTIQPLASTKTWDQIKTQASIVFDQNPPIATPAIVNTIDSDYPVSTLDSNFIAPDDSHLRVRWSGDDHGQSGVSSFTLFVSVNDSAYVPWLVATTLTQAFYPAVLGAHYKFMCVSRDSVDNVEPAGNTVKEVTFTADLIVGTSTPLELDPYAIRVYPNPHTEFFSVSIRGIRNESVRLRLLDLASKLILNQVYPDQQGDILLQVRPQGLAAGMYLLEVEIGDQRGVVKLVRE